MSNYYTFYFRLLLGENGLIEVIIIYVLLFNYNYKSLIVNNK